MNWHAEDDDEFDDEDDEVEFGEENYTPTQTRERAAKLNDRKQHSNQEHRQQHSSNQEQKADPTQEGLTSSQIAELEAAMRQEDQKSYNNDGFNKGESND